MECEHAEDHCLKIRSIREATVLDLLQCDARKVQNGRESPSKRFIYWRKSDSYPDDLPVTRCVTGKDLRHKHGVHSHHGGHLSAGGPIIARKIDICDNRR